LAANPVISFGSRQGYRYEMDNGLLQFLSGGITDGIYSREYIEED